MRNIYCTLFNHGYIDKGLVLIDSLEKTAKSFKLYIFAMDGLTYKVLSKINKQNVIPIDVSNIEDDNLKRIKKERSLAEYCWTWTPLSILYVINNYNEKICTYIDADMYFYDNPEILIDEMLNHNCNVQIVKHNFPDDKLELEKIVGKYCVEFNTFTNESTSISILNEWSNQCIEMCSYNKQEGIHGDQMYLSEWPNKYKNVHVCGNIGAGLAPWNTRRYLYKMDGNSILIKDKNGDNFSNVVFYHFQNLRYMSSKLANINLEEKNSFVRDNLYIPYLYEIEKKRIWLKREFGIVFSIKKSSYKNPLLKFIQNYIMPFRVKRFSNIVRIRRIK